jgi:hypothetical protein
VTDAQTDLKRDIGSDMMMIGDDLTPVALA